MKSISKTLEFVSRHFVPVVTALAVCLPAQCAEPCPVLQLEATTKGELLHFRLTNPLDYPIETRHDFSHWQNMYLVVLHERHFGEVVRRTSYSGDPLLGSYSILSGGFVEEDVSLTISYPELSELRGSALVFWSADIPYVAGRRECNVRMSGSLRVSLPIAKSH